MPTSLFVRLFTNKLSEYVGFELFDDERLMQLPSALNLHALGNPQKNRSSFFSGPATIRGGAKGLATKKNNFFEALKNPQKMRATKKRTSIFLRLP